MVHALREIHRAIRPRGILLDVHPLPRNPVVEVHRDREITVVGELDDRVGVREIRAARAALTSVVRDGYFAVERARWFDMREYFPSVESYLARREYRGSSSVLTPTILEKMHSEMRRPGGELVIYERTRGTRLRRLDRAPRDERPRSDDNA